MQFTTYLKNQLTDFVDTYEEYFIKTIWPAFIFTVFCFFAMLLLLKYSAFDTTSSKKQISLLSYFWVRYSSKNIFSIIDEAKSVFLFFVSLFSIGLIRLKAKQMNEAMNLSFIAFIKSLRLYDLLFLSIVLLLCSAIDLALFRSVSALLKTSQNLALMKWISSLFFLLRIYLPLLLFSIAIHKLTSNKRLRLNLKKAIFLFVSLWLFNEFAYEASLFVRSHIFTLLLSPFSKDSIYVIESLLAIALVTFYFLGYSSAMTHSLKQLTEEEDVNIEH